MKWKIGYSREAEKFINKQDIREKVRNALKKFLQAMKGESVNLDLTKLSGNWKGYYRTNTSPTVQLRRLRPRLIFTPLAPPAPPAP